MERKTEDPAMTVDNELLAIIAKLHAIEFEAAADMLKAGGGTPLLTAASDAADNAVDHVLAAAARVGGGTPLTETVSRGISTGPPLDLGAPPPLTRPA